MLADFVSVLLRALSFIALLQAAGVAIFLVVFGHYLSNSSSRIRRIGLVSALSGLIFVSGHYLLEAARMAGQLSGALDMSLQSLALHSALSVALGFRMVGLVVIAIGMTTEGRRANALNLLGATLVIVAFMFVGHTAVHAQRLWLDILLGVHLLIVAFWFGALVPLYVTTRNETVPVAANIVDRFSRTAGWVVPGIFLAGAIMTWIFVDRWATFLEPYGELLLAKVTSFALLMGVATLNKWRFGPAMRSSTHAAASLRQAIIIEYLLIVIVLVVTAVMTTFFSPEQA